MYELYIANKNYSSWSLRPWLLLKALQIPFVEHLIPFGESQAWNSYRRLSPNRKVPCLIDGAITVWDSLAITEYLAEAHPAVWPAERVARAWARCAAAEMHSGFAELRSRCSMSCGVTLQLKEFPVALETDVARMSELWSDGLARFGGPWLAGNQFTAVDAFFAPVAFRVRTYGLTLAAPAADYAQRLLQSASMREWYEDAVRETYRDQPHEEEMSLLSTFLKDSRQC